MLTARTYEETHTETPATADPTPVSRVLVFRTCRMPQFLQTLAWLRARWPAATIDAVSAPGFDAPLTEAGVGRVFHYSGRSLGLLRHARLVRRLRAERFDAVVIAQANGLPVHHANLYRVAAAIGAPRVVVAALDRDPEIHEARAFGWMTVHTTLFRVVEALDIPLLLAALVLAALWPRPRLQPAAGRRRVLHIITSFGVGGAQVQLAELLGRTPPDRYDVHVMVIGRQDGDFSRQWLTRDDLVFHFAEGWPRRALAVMNVVRLCRQYRFDLVHTWLFVANMIGAAGARLAGTPRIIGSVRNMSLWKRTWYREWYFRLGDTLATWAADVVTVNATALADDHAAWAWYPAHRLVVVPNGLDPARLTPHREGARAWLRDTLGVPCEALVVGTVGRLAPEKDQAMFIRACARAIANRPDLHGVIAGGGALKEALAREIEAHGLGGRLHLLGERTDTRRIIAGLDAFVLTSQCEGFPNVLLEAAFLGVPAIATGIGGAVDLLPPEQLVPTGDAETTSRRLCELLEHPSEARQRTRAIEWRAWQHFTAERSTARWLDLYDTLLPAAGDGL